MQYLPPPQFLADIFVTKLTQRCDCYFLLMECLTCPLATCFIIFSAPSSFVGLVIVILIFCLFRTFFFKFGFDATIKTIASHIPGNTLP